MNDCMLLFADLMRGGHIGAFRKLQVNNAMILICHMFRLMLCLMLRLMLRDVALDLFIFRAIFY